MGDTTKKVIAGAIIFFFATNTISGCVNEKKSLPLPPNDDDCSDWEWDYDDGVYMCDDEDSRKYKKYKFRNKDYDSKSHLYQNPDFNSYKSSYSKSSGFGSGSKGIFGG